MRQIKVSDTRDPEAAKRILELYGPFALGPSGYPRETWEARHLRPARFAVQFQHAAFPEFCLKFVRVNRRMVPAIQSVFNEIAARWNLEVQAVSGLNRFYKCYCFGDGEELSLFWYGAAWQLSPLLRGDMLKEVVKIFVRNGFRPREDNERILEYW